MAFHLRRQIRNRVATTLTGLTTTGSNVFQSRVYPMETGGLPGLCIYTNDESVDIASIGATRTLFRELNLMVEGYASAGSSLEKTLDKIGKEIEVAMSGDIKINNLAMDSRLTNVEVSLSGDGSSSLGVIRHTYLVTYQNLENTPDSPA